MHKKNGGNNKYKTKFETKPNETNNPHTQENYKLYLQNDDVMYNHVDCTMSDVFFIMIITLDSDASSSFALCAIAVACIRINIFDQYVHI